MDTRGNDAREAALAGHVVFPADATGVGLQDAGNIVQRFNPG